MLKKIYFTASALLLSLQAYATLPPYSAVAVTSNQLLVAEQLDSFPPPYTKESDIVFFNRLNTLDEANTQRVLEQMSGQQYTSLFMSAEITNRQFLRRLYDPLRPLVSNPCSYTDEVYEMCSADGVDAWVEGSVSRSFLNGNKNAKGFKMSGYDVTGGAHKRLTSTWTLGAALFYTINHINYNVGGSSKSNTLLGGVYTLYRPAHYYFLSDVTFGYFTNDMHRRVTLAKPTKNNEKKPVPADQLDPGLDLIAKSRPSVSQAAFYGELGVDWNCSCVLIQPFVGFEANHFKRNCKYDHSYPTIRLIYNGKQATNAYSRLGVHLTAPENCYDITMAFDLAWQYRLTSSHNSLTVRFAEFGVPFNITGVPDERNSMSMAFTAWSEIFEGWRLYMGVSGECWKRVSSYSFTAGLIFKW